jgi:glucose/arabinose dehydrogenase
MATTCLVALSLQACGNDDGPSKAEGPGYGKEDSGDAADLDCRIILRELKMTDDGRKAIGRLDAEGAEVDAGGTPQVLFTFDVGAVAAQDFFLIDNMREVDGGLEGYQRFQFEIDLQENDAIELIPLLKTNEGRLFDHNRDADGVEGLRPDVRPGTNNDNYLAVRDRNFEIPLDENRCPRAKCRLPGVQIVRAYPGVTIKDPTSIKWEPNVAAGDRRVFVVEKIGRVLAFPDRDDVTDAEVQVFLDWSNKPGQPRDPEKTYNRGGRFGDDAPGWEEGFLDMTFHPDWPDVPEVYVTYDTGLGDPEDKGGRGEAFWNLARIETTDGGRTLDPSTLKTMIREKKSALTHNAGAILFHPEDKTMFVSIGTDGGFPFDLYENAQNPAKLFGSIIRIDVSADKRDPDTGYAIPEDNPFAGGTTKDGKAARPEVWTYGNRNPWRMNFDPETRELWGCEVGENTREECNIYEAGRNYGYPHFEGSLCTFRGEQARGCNGDGLEFPLFELYASDAQRPEGGIVGDSVTGGFLYRGTSLPDLAGWYVFGDFITGELLAYDPESGQEHPKIIAETGKSISSFGQSPEGELFFLNHQHREQAVEANPQERADGEIYKIEAAACQSAPPPPLVDYAFLSADGPGSERGAQAYYRSILPEGRTTDTYTLEQWKEDYVPEGAETVSALYKNCWDLCFWRDMTCTKEIGPGVGGCWVTNWSEEEHSPQAANHDPSLGASDLGTVCMNVSEEGYTRFYVFLPREGKGPHPDDARFLNPFAILDDEHGDGVTEDDKKFVPHVCTPCHSGIKYRINGTPDIGSIFREFEPGLMGLEFGATFTKETLEERFFQLNAASHSANSSLNTKTPMIDYLETRYPNGGPPAIDVFGRDANADAELPESWATDESEDPRIISAKRDLWFDLVNPYCMGCHRVRKVEVDFTEYERFRGLGKREGDQVGLFRFITGDPLNREDHPIFMPQTQWLFDRLNGPSGQLQPTDELGRAAVDAINEWLDALEAHEPQTCEVEFEVRGVDFTQPGMDVFITGQVGDLDTGDLGSWTPWEGLQLDGANFPNWNGTISLPDKAPVQFKVTVADRRQETKDQCGGNAMVFWELGPGNANRELKVGDGGCPQRVVVENLQFQQPFCE